MGQQATGGALSTFRNMFGQHRSTVLLIDPHDGGIRDVNPAAEAFYGYGREEFLALHIWDINADPKPAVRRLMREVLDSGGAQFEATHKLRDGTTKPVSVISGPIFPDGPASALLIAVVRDMTPELEARSAFEDSEARYRELVEAAPFAVYVQQDGIFVHANPATLSLFGVKRAKQLLGKRPIDFVHPDDKGAVAERAAGVLNGIEAPPRVSKVVRADGTIVYVEAKGKPIEFRGRPAAQVISYDVTDRIRAEESAAWLAAVVRSADEAIAGETLDGTITTWNAAAERIFGYAAEEIVGDSFKVLLPESDDGAGIEARRKVCETGHVQRILVERRRKDGGIITAALTLSPIRHIGGTIVGVSVIARDVTEEQRVARELEFRSFLLDRAGDWIFVLDPEGWHVLYVNEAACSALGYGIDEIKGMPPREIVESLNNTPVGEVLSESGEALFEIDARSKNGVLIRVEARLQEMRWWDRTVVVVFARDVTERNAAQAEIERMAFHDQYTGLANRILFNDRLETGLRGRKRSRDTLAVLFLDLDHFKDINDALGHDVGDHVLAEVAERLRTHIREADTIARLGGDEFTVLLRGFREVQDAVVVAHKLQQALAMPMHIEGRELYVSASIGISLATAFDETAGELLRKADSAMYRAKENGRNTIQFYDPEMNAAVLERIALEGDLRHALENDELSLVYQPQVALSDGRISRVEALLRWKHPVHGEVPPDVFIPIAEHAGLIDPIGEWALREACRQNREWIDAGLPPTVVAVNASHRQFIHGDLPATVASALEWSALDGSMLEVEITESVAMENAERTLEAFRRLRDLGVRVAIDDFGTGYSSLSHLKRFPIQTIKVDRSFIRDVCFDEHAAAIVHSIVALAHSLDLAVVAEGVETREQLEFLRAEDCDTIQGFLFSRALPPESFARVLERDERLQD